MKKGVIDSLLALLVGIAFASIVVWRIKSGKSYISKPAMPVSRSVDPFSFWLSLGFPAGVSAILLLVGLAGLWHVLNTK